MDLGNSETFDGNIERGDSSHCEVPHKDGTRIFRLKSVNAARLRCLLGACGGQKWTSPNVASSVRMTSYYQENLKVFFKSFSYSARIARDGVGPLHTDTRGVAAPPTRQRRLR